MTEFSPSTEWDWLYFSALVQTPVPKVLCAGLLKSGFDVFLFFFFEPLQMSNTKNKALTEALCEQSSISEVANSLTMTVGLSLCQCHFIKPEQNYPNQQT